MATTMLAITEGTTVLRLVLDPIVTIMASSCAGQGVVCRTRRNVLFGLLLVVGVAIAAPVYAADSAGGGAAGNAGYYGQFYSPGATPAASSSASAERRSTATAALRPREYIAPDANGLSYQPGFHGCVTEARIGSSIGGLRSGLAPLPPVAPEQSHRYIRYGISTAATYTDNVTLADDENAESAWVLQVVPSLDACADTGRVKASLDYQLQALYYPGSNVSDEIYNHVSAATTVEVLPGHLFLAADSSYGQTAINPADSFSSTNLLRPGNRTSAWITNLSPYWFQRLGSVGQATLRYRYARAEYGSSDVSDYTLNGVYFNLSSPRSNAFWSYQFNVATQRVKRDDPSAGAISPVVNDDGVTHFDSATLQVGYQVTDSFQLLAMGGAENDYQTDDGSVDRFGSVIWDVGFRWTSPHNALEAHYGERSFGSSYSVEATHHAATFDMTLAYHEDTTAAGLNELNRGGVGSGSIGSFRGPLASIQDQGVYVRKRLSARLAFDMARTRTTLQAYRESREFLTTNEPDEEVYGAGLQVRYQAGARTSVIPRVRWEHRDSDSNSGQDESDVAEAGVELNYLLTPSSQAAIDYSHSWRDGDTDSDSYDENRITVQYSVFF